MKQAKHKLWAALGLAAALLTGGLRAEEAEDANPEADLKVRFEAMEEAIEGLNARVKGVNNVHIDGFVNLRYDDQRNPNQASIPDANTANNGMAAMYARRAEFKFSGKLLPMVSYALGYDFTENKHKDLGIEVTDIPLVPFWDLAPGYTWTLRVGQYRMPFGINPQTSSSATWLPERPIIFGARGNLNSQIGFAALVGERIMGVQLRQKNSLAGIFGYDLQGGLFNNATQDQAAGQNRPQTASAPPAGAAPATAANFNLQVADQDPSFVGRFALEMTAVQGMLEGLLGKNKWQAGASYIRDSTNTVYQAQSNAAISYAEVLGVEGLIELWNKGVMIQGEYVKRVTGINAAVGAANTNTKDGWHVDLAWDTLPLILGEIEKGDSLQLIARLEEQGNYSGAAGKAASPTRVGGSLKWNYAGGRSHTSVSYLVTSPDMMFGGDYRGAADGGTGIQVPETQFIIQQQFAFDTR